MELALTAPHIGQGEVAALLESFALVITLMILGSSPLRRSYWRLGWVVMSRVLKQWTKRSLELARLWPLAQRIRDSKAPYMVRRDNQDMKNLWFLLPFWLDPTSNCVDVGANKGDLLAQFLAVAPHGRHIAYEPLPALAQDLRTRFPSVDVRGSALSDRQGTSSFIMVKDLLGYSGFREQWYPKKVEVETIQVPVTRLDDEMNGFRPHLIKIDVEGAEREVIAGGIETIARHKPVVVFEHYQGGASAYGTTPAQIHDLLVTQAGLVLYDIDGTGPYSPTRLEEVFESRELWTFVARSPRP